jgi:hypothetical protein
MKKEAKIRPFWYSDVWLFPKLITIITTLDAQAGSTPRPTRTSCSTTSWRRTRA